MTGGDRPTRAGAEFPSTRWSLFLAGRAGGDARRAAYDELAVGYREPIRAYLRRAFAHSTDRADDLAQAFFVWSIESGFLGKADPTRGRFRSFLKVALRHFVFEQRRKERATLRGGDTTFESWTRADEGSIDVVDPDALQAEDVLDRAWKSALIERALARMRTEFDADGRSAVFAVFREYVLEPAPDVDYGTIAARHGLTKADVSNYLQRAKHRFRAALRTEVTDTVRDPDALTEEWAWLFAEQRP